MTRRIAIVTNDYIKWFVWTAICINFY